MDSLIILTLKQAIYFCDMEEPILAKELLEKLLNVVEIEKQTKTPQ